MQISLSIKKKKKTMGYSEDFSPVENAIALNKAFKKYFFLSYNLSYISMFNVYKSMRIMYGTQRKLYVPVWFLFLKTQRTLFLCYLKIVFVL